MTSSTPSLPMVAASVDVLFRDALISCCCTSLVDLVAGLFCSGCCCCPPVDVAFLCGGCYCCCCPLIDVSPVITYGMNPMKVCRLPTCYQKLVKPHLEHVWRSNIYYKKSILVHYLHFWMNL